MSFGYPIVLDLVRRSAVIVGGGAVAVRKAKGLLAGGIGRLRCVARDFSADMPAQVERIQGDFAPEHLDGFDLVFAATDDPRVNAAVVAEAHRRGSLVNRADGDEDEPGDFSVPALWRGDALTVAVSAAGAPALAAKARDQIAASLDPIYVLMANAMQTLRPAIQSVAGLTTRQRQDIFRALAGDEAFAVLRTSGLAGLKAWLGQRFPGLGDLA